VKNALDANHPAKLKVYGITRGARAYAIRDFLTRGYVPFEWVEVTGDDQARAIGLENMADQRLPVCVFVDGSRVDRATIRQIAEKLGW
jgi:thioredoxin reductase (NADPH)